MSLGTVLYSGGSEDQVDREVPPMSCLLLVLEGLSSPLGAKPCSYKRELGWLCPLVLNLDFRGPRCLRGCLQATRRVCAGWSRGLTDPKAPVPHPDFN